MATLIAPSILSADFGRLAAEVQALEAAGADWIHVDVMDGRFVPNLSIGPPVLTAIRQATRLPLDVHLMIVEPDRYLEAFCDAGADWLTVHAEACPHAQRTLARIRELGARAGLALNPGTSHEVLRYLLADLDLVLCMSVNPGFGGQAFLPSVLAKLRATRELLDQAGRDEVLLEVDGGVVPDRSADLRDAGCQVLVAGTAVLGSADYSAAIAALRNATGS